MQKSDQFEKVGQVLKSDGTDGSLVIRLFDNYYESPRIDGDFSLYSLEEAFKSCPLWIYFDGLPVPFFAELRGGRGTKLIVGLTDINTREDADALVGKALYLAGTDEEADENQDFSGWTLVNTSGREKESIIGTIMEVDDIPGNPLLVVKPLPSAGSESPEVLIPLHEDLVISADAKSRTLVMTIPEGLLS